MNLSFAYGKLLEKTGYSFVVLPDGEVVDWDHFVGDRAFTGRLHIVPGSFNPLHNGHREIHDVISATPGHTFFEMSIERVDKEMVGLAQLGDRLAQFEGYGPVIVTRAARFIEKIGTLLQHGNKLTFHVGIDTITRMRDDYSTLGIQGLAARFTVHERIMDGKHLSLASEFGENVPRNCTSSPALRSVESLSVSSTKIRNGG